MKKIYKPIENCKFDTVYVTRIKIYIYTHIQK